MGDATYPAVPGSPSAPRVDDVLEVIEQFALASIGLVAWELFLDEEDLVPAWRELAATGVLERVGRCPYTREPMYRLSAPPGGSMPAAGHADIPVAFLGSAEVNLVTRLTTENSPRRDRDESPQPI
jgi:hypothetical protein